MAACRGRWMVLTIGLVLGLVASARGAEGRPNVVLIVADDLGWGDVGFNGREDWATPHLDRLASRGLVLSRCYAGAVVCGPSRAALLSGRDTIHQGVRRNEDDLPAAEVTIAEALKGRGYATSMFGKWHRGRPRPGEASYTHPMDQGFDEFYGFTDPAHAFEKFPTTLWHGRKRVPSSGYADDGFADRAVARIGRKGDGRPFFLYLAPTAPHFHVEAPDDEVALHKGRFAEDNPAEPIRATYAAMITRLDRQVGRVLAALDEAGVADNTLVIFTSDHGATFEAGNLGTSLFHGSNRPFRGAKRTLYEGGLRVPFVVSWPARIAPGTRRDDPGRLTDLLPTLLDAAGGSPDPAWHVDGADLLPAWTSGSPSPERALCWEWRSEGSQLTAAMRGRHKLIVGPGGRAELFDVVADPAESRDLAPGSPEVARRLRAELDAWLATETNPRSTPIPDRSR